MSTEQSDDDGVVKNFKFAKQIADEHERWIGIGYFANHEEIAANAFGMLRNAVLQLENDKKVIAFNAIVVDIQVELPETLSHRTLN